MSTLPVKDRTPALTADGADLLALVELALGEARALGASEVEAAISMDVGVSVSARLGEVAEHIAHDVEDRATKFVARRQRVRRGLGRCAWLAIHVAHIDLFTITRKR